MDAPDPRSKQLVTEGRLRQIAANRLRSLGIAVYLAGPSLRGRMKLDPSLFTNLEGVQPEAIQSFEVHGHEFLEFLPPSPLRCLGLINFFSASSNDDLQVMLSRLWNVEMVATERKLEQARMYLAGAVLEPSSCAVEATIQSLGARVTFAFQDVPDGGTRLALVAVGEQAVEPGSVEPWFLNLPEETTLFSPHQLEPIVRAALTPKDELDVAPIDLGPVDKTIDVPPRASMEAPATQPPQGRPTLRPTLAPVAQPPPEEVPAEKALSLAPVQQRRPRAKVDVLARLTYQGHSTQVRFVDANLGGVFARMSLEQSPPDGATVTLSGFGPLSIDARVAHRRSAEEARLFGTGEGLGLAFVEPAGRLLAQRQCEGFVLLLAAEGEGKNAAIAACAAVGAQVMLASNLASAAVWMASARFALVILDAHLEHGAWEVALHALHLPHLPLSVALLGPPKGKELPANVKGFETAAFDAKAVQGLLARAGEERSAGR